MEASKALEVIWSMMVAYIHDHHIEPTAALIDPRLWRELAIAAADPFGPINPRTSTVFGLAVIEVYKPYPYLAICHLMSKDE